MFLILLLSIFVNSAEKCDFLELPAVVDSMQLIAKPSRGFLSKVGLKTIDVYPGPEIFQEISLKMDSEFFKYLLGCASLAVPFLILLVILFLFFAISLCCCCCPCFRPKTSKKPACMSSIVHLGGATMMIISAVLFLIAAINVANGLQNVSKLPSKMSATFKDIFGSVNKIFDGVFDSIDGSIDNLESGLNNFTKWMETGSDTNTIKANAVLADMPVYKQTFSSTPYTTDMSDLKAALAASNLPNKGVLDGRLQAMETSLTPGVKAITDLAQRLKDSGGDMSTTINNIKSTITGSLSAVSKQVNDFKNSSLTSNFDSFEGSINKIVSSVMPIETYMGMANQYIGPVIYAATAFLIIVAVLYAIIFFCRNKVSRCLVMFFPLFGLLLTILIIVPGVVFSLLFFVFYDICPDLEKVAETFVGDSFGNISGLLLCPVDQPILNMVNLDFNYTKIIDDLAKDAQTQLQAFEVPDGLGQSLDNFGENFDIDKNISSEWLLLDHTNTLSSIYTLAESSSDAQKGTITNKITSMQIKISDNEESLTATRDLMRSVVGFGSQIIPQVTATKEQTANLVSEFTGDAKNIIGAGIDNITCQSVKCIYSPVKNALCVNLMTGISFWLISSICMASGISVMAISLCKRRKQMAAPKVKSSSGSDEDSGDEDLSDFKKKK